MRVYIAALFFFISGISECYAEPDSLYIRPFKNQLIISLFTASKVSTLDYEFDNNERIFNLQTYHPNSSVGMGVGLAWNWLSVSATLYNFKPNEKYGKTTSFDFQTHWFFSKFQLSISLQDYTGFYTKDEENEDAIIIRPDLHIKQYYAFGQYVFNNKKFSYMSAFSYDQQQLRSAGSLKAGLGIYYSEISADSSLYLGNSGKNRIYYKDYQIGPNVGYAHTFVFWRRCYFTASITAGLGLSVKNSDSKFRLFPTFLPRGSLGYNGNNWTVGVSAQVSRLSIAKINDSRTSINSGILQFTFTYRLPLDIKRIFFQKKKLN